MFRASDKLRDWRGEHPSSLVVHVMTQGVVQIPGDVSVREAALIMQKEHVPCLLVKDSDDKIGIMTHADIVHKVVARGLNPADVGARTIMSRPVHAIEFDQPLERASTVMASNGVPLLLVTKLNRPIGILTARDVLFSPARCGSRIAASLKVQDGKTSVTTQVATISQLSHLGAFVETPIPLPPGTSVSLNFYLPGSARPIVAHATVLKCRGQASSPVGEQDNQPAGMEVEFARLSGSDQSQITAWVIRTFYKQSGEH